MNAAISNGPLAGKNILVTRPAAQAEGLAALIRAAGGEAILFPTIEIRDPEDWTPLDQVIDRLDEYGLAVFVSPNAVEKAMSRIAARRKLPPGLAIAAVGPGSVRALARFGVDAVIAPAGGFDSEALLALPQLVQLRGRRVVVFRGEGGRELLADTLKARGATVEHVTCYRRARPAVDAAPMAAGWRRDGLAGVTATSSEGLRNLVDMIGKSGRTLLEKTPHFVPHPRIAQAARELGIVTVILTEPGDAGMVAGLVRYFSDQ